MINATLKVSLKLEELRRRQQRKRARVLFRCGGFGRSVMQNRITSAKKSSKSPAAPKSKTKDLKRHCEFAVDVAAGTVLIGFVRFRSDHAKPLGGRTVPETIDGGGRELLTQDARTTPEGKAVPAKVIEADYQPRPISEPARQPTVDKCLELQRDVPL